MPFPIDEQGKAFLQQQWNQLCAGYESSLWSRNSAFALLQEKYLEKQRAYHNLSHIRALLEHADSFRTELSSYDSVAFAIWFHDAIYHTKRNDNEEKSAALAEEMLGQLSVPREMIAASKQMILATKQHELLLNSADLKLFLDFDLAILGTSAEVYQRYRQAIRKEYSWVPYFLYRKGRKKVLESFLKRERLYFSDAMNARYEAQARRNIEAELNQLS
jgi:predicted metal-dependent HD superfamily phosphohydrolase